MTGAAKKEPPEFRPCSIGRAAPVANYNEPSWYCDQCHQEVLTTRCRYCGKTKREVK